MQYVYTKRLQGLLGAKEIEIENLILTLPWWVSFYFSLSSLPKYTHELKYFILIKIWL